MMISELPDGLKIAYFLGFSELQFFREVHFRFDEASELPNKGQ
jgi:hypothetical protein